jgi:hypothetical protein
MLKFQALFENIYWFLSSLNVSAEFLSAWKFIDQFLSFLFNYSIS